MNPVPQEVSTIPRHKFEIVELGEVCNIARSYAPDETPIYVTGDLNIQLY